MTHLRFEAIGAYNENVMEHPQVVMKNLGITYQHATPQSMADQWWFWNCKNIPEKLPPYLSVLNIEDPLKFVGWGLSEEDALAIKNGV